MTDKTFMRADEVAEELDVSKAYAYKIIRQLNDELSAKGLLQLQGVSADSILVKEFTEQKGEMINARLQE